MYSFIKAAQFADAFYKSPDRIFYKDLLSFLFAIEEINKDPNILPNVTLGYHIFDSCRHPKEAVKSVMQVLTGSRRMVPNYVCRGHGKLAGVIGDVFTDTTLSIAQVLGIYGYTQITHGATDLAERERNLYPSLFRALQDNRVHYYAIAKLLEYFTWTGIGVLVSNEKSGGQDIEELIKQTSKHGICIEYIIKIKTGITNYDEISSTIHNAKSTSKCSEICPPGYRKAEIEGKPTCCYECVSCAEGEISNTTDSDNCWTCPDYEWPSEKKDQCHPKVIEFLSYSNDHVVIIFLFILVLFSCLTLLILGIFIFYLDTPIVKANNQNLSFLLLVSIILSYLCVFLFIGRPVDITCQLRHISFGIIFSIAVSSLLAKTIMVGIAFQAAKPGSNWRKWVGTKVSNYIVVISSSIQVIICVSWLVISPPFQEMNMHSVPRKIIVQCNEGSAFAFYSVLGYMGLLAAVSFVIAFYTRTLPDSFNEAKFITFSMLVFCSVWIAMIPAYLSTKGKQIVAVEIFAILASNTGLLGCICFPKCYIILFRPEMNTKKRLLGRVQKHF
ncbi:vomeronasal type-2 receptor 26-like [Discoglossus pictus]